MRLGWFLVSIVLLALLAAPAHAAADDLADEFAVVNESDPVEWNNKGVALYNEGNYEEALIYFDRALELDPEYAYAWNGKGNALNRLGDYEEARICFDKALEIDSNFSYALNGKGNALVGLGKYDEALDCYEKAIDINPMLVNALNGKGNALYYLGRYDDALIYFDRALELDPEYAYAWNGKGNALNRLGDYEEARICFDKALEIDSNFSYALNGKGNALVGLGKYDEALDCYEKAIDINPMLVNALNGKGTALYYVGRYDDALIYFDEALELDPEYAYAWNGKGYALNRLIKYNDSLICFKKALEIDPKLVNAWNGKGTALEGLNRSTEAAMAYSLGRESKLNSERKWGIFAAFLFVFAAGGYAFSRRHPKYAISIAILSINLLGFWAMMWILSGFFDLLLIGQFFLGGIVMVLIPTALWSLSGFPANPWKDQLAQEIENFNEKCPRFSRFIRAVGLLSALSYAFMATIFYFRLHLGTEISMVDFLKIAFGSIFLLGLLVTLPPIWSAMISKNLDGRTRELLIIFQFGHLGLSGLYSGMILWIFGKGSFSHSLSLGDIKFPISIHSLGIVMFLFVLAVIIPYVSGSKRASKWRTTLFEKERRWLDELVDILDYPTPNLYVSKLQKVMAEIKGEDPISGQEEELDRIKSLYGAEVLRLDPRSRHREFSMKLQEQIAEMITQFEEIGDEEKKIRENAPIFADAYRLRREEIIGMIEREGKFKPKFWIALAIILTPVLGQILAALINSILQAMIDTNLGGLITATPAFPIPLPLS